MVSRRKRQRRRRNTALTVALLICVITAGWFWKNDNTSIAIVEKPVKETLIIAQKGSTTRSSLADGNSVWINAGSKLYYASDFSGATREVRLEGEAFFDVVKQANRPFIVHASGIDIKVLGTAFNVKSYPEDKNVETTLYRGLVQVLRHEDSLSKPIQLRPNHKLILPKQAAIETVKMSEVKMPLTKGIPTGITITPIDSTKKESERLETAWRYNRLEFEGEYFEDVAKKMERWYNVSIIFTDDKVKRLEVVGKFENETVEQAFAALKEGFPITFKIDKNEILVGSSY